MSKFKANPTFKAPVKIKTADGEQIEMICTFRHKRRTEADKLVKEIDSGRSPEDWISEVLEGWDIAEERYQEKYTRKALSELIEEHASAPQVFMHAYLAGLFGARQGN